MASFDDFYKSLPLDANKRGEVFEKIFIPWFLRTDPEWGQKVSKIWLWGDYPGRWGKDCGIDLVFEDDQGHHWAVQCKCISPDREISKAEIDSFLSESNDPKIYGRLLIASTDGIGKNALQVIERQEKKVVCFLRNHFIKSKVVFPSSIANISTGHRQNKPKPRPHQEEAISNVVEGLKRADRGQLLMACGTGKTLTALWIKEAINAKRVLVLLPSLNLVAQTLREWTASSEARFKWCCVCSDQSVSKQDKSIDSWVENISEIGLPVTTDVHEIKRFIINNEHGIVFSTYQSSELVAEAQISPNVPGFDLVIADEAHRCVGKVSSAFGCVVDGQKIKADKRLFMTATPRVFSRHVKTRARTEEIELASMDDATRFGEVLHSLNFSEAIKQELLTDYRVVVVGIDDLELKSKIANRSLSLIDDEVETDFETLANHISLSKAIQEYSLRRVITYHGRIKAAQDFSKNHRKIVDWASGPLASQVGVSADYVSGKMSSLERNNKINYLRNLGGNEVGILANARCLSEGVDVPDLDGIAFIDPRRSQIDIVQAVGRAIRRSESKSFGYIIIPVYFGDIDAIEEEVLGGKFKDVWEVVLALRSQDDSLSDTLDKFRFELGFNKDQNISEEGLSKIIFDLPERVLSRVSGSIYVSLVRNVSEDWHQFFGELKRFSAQNGHCRVPNDTVSGLYRWIIYQRALWKKKRLSKDRISQLEALDGWTWSPHEDRWFENYMRLKQFADNHGHSSPIPSLQQELFDWINIQRMSIRKGKLDPRRCSLLRSLPKWVDNPRDQQWERRLAEITDFCNRYGHSYPSKLQVPVSLINWLNVKRSAYASKELDQSQIKALERLPGWTWKSRDPWREKFDQLHDYAISHGTSNIPRTVELIGPWVKKQRTRYNANDLSSDQISLLEGLPGWTWDPVEDMWNDKLQELIRFAEIHGHTRPLRDEMSLGSWTSTQRSAYAKGTLREDRVLRLEEISSWSWDVRDQDWQINFDKIKSYIATHGALPSKGDSSFKAWMSWQRGQFKKGLLSQERIEKLESIELWVW